MSQRGWQVCEKFQRAGGSWRARMRNRYSVLRPPYSVHKCSAAPQDKTHKGGVARHTAGTSCQLRLPVPVPRLPSRA